MERVGRVRQRRVTVRRGGVRVHVDAENAGEHRVGHRLVIAVVALVTVVAVAEVQVSVRAEEHAPGVVDVLELGLLDEEGRRVGGVGRRVEGVPLELLRVGAAAERTATVALAGVVPDVDEVVRAGAVAEARVEHHADGAALALHVHLGAEVDDRVRVVPGSVVGHAADLAGALEDERVLVGGGIEREVAGDDRARVVAAVVARVAARVAAAAPVAGGGAGRGAAVVAGGGVLAPAEAPAVRVSSVAAARRAVGQVRAAIAAAGGLAAAARPVRAASDDRGGDQRSEARQREEGGTGLRPRARHHG